MLSAHRSDVQAVRLGYTETMVGKADEKTDSGRRNWAAGTVPVSLILVQGDEGLCTKTEDDMPTWRLVGSQLEPQFHGRSLVEGWGKLCLTGLALGCCKSRGANRPV